MNYELIKACLFDLDGVIFDTEPQYSVFWGGECRRYFPDRPGLENEIKGQTLTQIYGSVFASLPDEQPKITQRLNDFERQMSFDYVSGFQPFIEHLRAKGILTAVVTSSNQEKMKNVRRAHPEFDSYFDAVLTSEDFTQSKPHPDCYLKAAERLGVAPHECVGFEDSFNGLRSVRSAGMTVVGLSTTNPAESIAPFADIVVGDYNNQSLSTLLK
ncbi:MAG: HAD family phosphatase [Prevotella sp.]|nr:HAD family phosphatase [Prevotella sp.]